MDSRFPLVFVVTFVAMLVLAVPARSQVSGEMPRAFDGVGMDEQLGEYVPADVVLRDAQGEQVTLGRYLNEGRPVVLSLIYNDCPMLCNLMTDGLVATMRDMAWTPGEEYTVLSVSFNPREGADLARSQKDKYVETLGRPAAARGWHFLTGTEENIKTLTAAVGFNFRWVEEKQQYAHPAALVFLSPDGKITRYLYGLERPARDMRNALVEAGDGTVGNVLDQAILYCFQYDPDANSYVAQAFNIMKLGGVVTMLVLGALLVFFWRREGRALDALTNHSHAPSS